MSQSPGQSGLDAEALYRDLRGAVQTLRSARTQLAGIASGGAWLARRLHADLGLQGAPGVISSSMHRDDYARRGLAAGAQSELPFEVEGADILLIDDVLYTGRTIRAALNELFDYGRPARVRLAVLVDRGGRELPVQAEHVCARLDIPMDQSLELLRDETGRFAFSMHAAPGGRARRA